MIFLYFKNQSKHSSILCQCPKSKKKTNHIKLHQADVKGKSYERLVFLFAVADAY